MRFILTVVVAATLGASVGPLWDRIAYPTADAKCEAAKGTLVRDLKGRVYCLSWAALINPK